MFEFRNLAITLPKFDILAVDELFCEFHRGGIVGAIYLDRLVGPAIGIQGAKPVLSRRPFDEMDVEPFLVLKQPCGCATYVRFPTNYFPHHVLISLTDSWSGATSTDQYSVADEQ